jgi:putative CocE/NonD family hydrolase
MIGPWTHGGQDESKSGERDFGPSAPIDYDELILCWMDHHLRNIDNGVDREKPVRLFVMGDNAWRDEDSWPLARAKETSYYLNAPESASRTGTLYASVISPSARTSEFVSDPAHPLTDPYTEYGAHDYRAFASRDDVLVFDTMPLQADTEVTGPIRVEIYASADVPDFDLWVRLLDVSPDGTAFNLMSPGLDVLRASYRNASLKPELLAPGKVYLLNLDRMLTSNVFRAGHRIRVQISAAFSPHFSRNLQTGESEITSSQTQLGHIRIYHDAEHSSRIVLPIISRAKQ